MASQALKTPSNLRTKPQLRVIKGYFEDFEYFKMYSDQEDKNEIMDQFSKLVKVRSCEKGEIIFHFGSPSTKFYLILNGSVKVYLPKEIHILQDELLKEKELREKAQRLGKEMVIKYPKITNRSAKFTIMGVLTSHSTGTMKSYSIATLGSFYSTLQWI